MRYGYSVPCAEIDFLTLALMFSTIMLMEGPSAMVQSQPIWTRLSIPYLTGREIEGLEDPSRSHGHTLAPAQYVGGREALRTSVSGKGRVPA